MIAARLGIKQTIGRGISRAQGIMAICSDVSRGLVKLERSGGRYPSLWLARLSIVEDRVVNRIQRASNWHDETNLQSRADHYSLRSGTGRMSTWGAKPTS